MKSILIFDTPTRCYDCPLYTPIDEYGFCDDRNILGQEEAQEMIRFDEKPTWCPLRPLPQKLDANDWHRMFSGKYDIREAKGYGWNVCLDVITGETE